MNFCKKIRNRCINRIITLDIARTKIELYLKIIDTNRWLQEMKRYVYIFILWKLYILKYSSLHYEIFSLSCGSTCHKLPTFLFCYEMKIRIKALLHPTRIISISMPNIYKYYSLKYTTIWFMFFLVVLILG